MKQDSTGEGGLGGSPTPVNPSSEKILSLTNFALTSLRQKIC